MGRLKGKMAEEVEEDKADLKMIAARRGEPTRAWEEVKKMILGAAKKKNKAA